MRLFLETKNTDRIEFGVIYGLIAVILLGVARWPPILSLAPGCVFKGLTGLPCPTCGSTRSLVHLSHGDIMPAMSMNPLVTLAMISAVLYFLFSLIAFTFDVPRIRCTLTGREKRILRAAAVIILLTQWGYLMNTL